MIAQGAACGDRVTVDFEAAAEGVVLPVYLASPEASYISSTIISGDGSAAAYSAGIPFSRHRHPAG